jgi:hypothetical protein
MIKVRVPDHSDYKPISRQPISDKFFKLHNLKLQGREKRTLFEHNVKSVN